MKITALFLLTLIREQLIALLHAPGTKLFHRVFCNVGYWEYFRATDAILLHLLPLLISRRLIMLKYFPMCRLPSRYCNRVEGSSAVLELHYSLLLSLIEWFWNHKFG